MGDYVRRGGLRFVRPYYFDYFAYVKPRWEGATVVDLFTREFTGRSREYYQAALLAGRLRVDDTSMSAPRKNGGKRAKPRAAGDAVGAAAPQDAPAPAPRPQLQPPPAQPAQDAPLQSSQRVRHFVHRHEPPVRRAARGRRTRSMVHVAHRCECVLLCDVTRSATQVLDMPIDIVATTDTAVAVCKPASMPVHPTVRRERSNAAVLCSLATPFGGAGAVPQEQLNGHPRKRGAAPAAARAFARSRSALTAVELCACSMRRRWAGCARCIA